MKLVILLILLIILSACKSQQQIEYNHAMKSEKISDLNDYVRKYPDDKNIEQVIYRLRILEYEYIKKSTDISMLKYFITRFKAGKDVVEIKNKLFEIQFKKFNDANDLTQLKSLMYYFSEKSYLDRIEKAIYLIREKNIISDINVESVKQFITDYPTSSLTPLLQKKLSDIDFNEILKTNDLVKFQNFLKNNKDYYTNENKIILDNLLFEHYKKQNIEIIETFLDNNKSFSKYSELEKVLVEKKYKYYIAFFEFDNLIELYKNKPDKNYEESVNWFKSNKEKVNQLKISLDVLKSPLSYSEEDKLAIYNIHESSADEAVITLKMSFFIDDISLFLKKTDSYFFIIHLTHLYSLQMFYNQNIEKNKVEFLNKIKFLKELKDVESLKKQMYLYFVMGDYDNFILILKALAQENERNLFVKFLIFYFTDAISTASVITTLEEDTNNRIDSINSDKSIHKNKADHLIQLFYLNKIINFIVNKANIDKIIYNKEYADKINFIKTETVKGNIEKNPFSVLSEFINIHIETANKIIQSKMMKEELSNYLLNTHPLNEVKYLLREQTSFEKQKDEFFKLFF